MNRLLKMEKMNPGSVNSRARAFTLIELLVTIAIIAILSAILLPAMSAGKRKAFQIQCVSNYKQVGEAIHMFTDDNKDWLPPGPSASDASAPVSLDLTEMPDYNVSLTNYLPYYLVSYLSLPAPAAVGNNTNVVKVLLCPGYAHGAPANTQAGYHPGQDNYAHAFCYSMTRISNPDLGYPFGKQNQQQQPLKLSQVAAVVSLSKTWAVADFDWATYGWTLNNLPPAQMGVNKIPYIPIQPVHKTVRNFLYFDFHVESKNVADSYF